ncbi:MAG: hypothetical protein HYU69_05310 [Bacteroidetes bacterium]|nr:hypothetical protein [Bacteroidota bacterium]
MAIYRFKVKFEDHEEVFRVIEIRTTQTFKDFHNAIQQAIGFDNSKNASFYMSDDFWRKGTEITLKDETEEDVDLKRKPKRLMHKSKMAEFIEDPHQKILYLFDFDAQWSFTIELIKIIVDEDVIASYPRCINSAGIAPRQYKPTTLPPVAEDDDDEPGDLVEKIFHHEEGLDDEDEDEEGKLPDGDEEETEEDGAGHEEAEEEL